MAAAMAAVGMYFLCVNESFSLNLGDVLVFICALFFTAHIMVVDYFSPKTDGVVISLIQFTVCGILCMICAFIWGSPAWSQVTSGISTLLYAGVMSCWSKWCKSYSGSFAYEFRIGGGYDYRCHCF